MLATVLAGTVVARDESVGRAVEEIPAAQRAVRAGLVRHPGPDEDHADTRPRARGDRSPASSPRSRPRSSSSGRARSPARYIGLGAVDGLDDWVTLRSGRLPRTCEPERCEVVRLRGAGRDPERARACGSSRSARPPSSSPVLFGDFIAPAENERGRAALSPSLRDAGALPPARAAAARPRRGRRRARRARPSSRTCIAATPGSSRSSRRRARLEDRRASPSDVAQRPVVAAEHVLRGLRPDRAARGTARAAECERGRGAQAPARRRRVGGAALRVRRPGRGQHAPRHRGGAAPAHLVRRPPLAALPLHRAGGGGVAAVGTAVGWALGSAAGAVVASRAGAPVGRGARALDALEHRAPGRGIVVAARSRSSSSRHSGRSRSPWPALVLGPGRGRAGRARRHRAHAAPRRPRPGDARGGVGHVGRARPPARARHLRRRGRVRTAPATRRSCSWSGLSRGRSVSLRLAALSLARHPGHAAVAAAFLLVSVGLAVFAESYRTTLERGQEEQAAFAVPLDFTLRRT